METTDILARADEWRYDEERRCYAEGVTADAQAALFLVQDLAAALRKSREALRKTCEFGNEMGKMRLGQLIESEAEVRRLTAALRARIEALEGALREAANAIVSASWFDDPRQGIEFALKAEKRARAALDGGGQ